MIENNLIPKEIKTRDALLISLSGGIIGIIGVIAESGILTSQNIDNNSAISMGMATLAGFSMTVLGVEKIFKFKERH